jgi:hypothetical protein
MEQWFSGVIPYPSLLTIQILMLVLMTKVSGEVWCGKGTFAIVRPHWSNFLIKFSACYAGLLAFRYLLTMILRPEMRWFGQMMPIFFHFVLAGFIFVLGHYHKVAVNR